MILTTNKNMHVVAYQNSFSKNVQIAPLITNFIHMHSTHLPLRMLLCGKSLLDFLFSILGAMEHPTISQPDESLTKLDDT